eukprot:scaffold5163_cov66-Phaeocystis_antarctica.AAC.4
MSNSTRDGGRRQVCRAEVAVGTLCSIEGKGAVSMQPTMCSAGCRGLSSERTEKAQPRAGREGQAEPHQDRRAR